MLDYLLKLNGEEQSIGNKLLNDLQLHAYIESGFYTWINLKNFTCDERIVDIIKNGIGFIYFKKNIG